MKTSTPGGPALFSEEGNLFALVPEAARLHYVNITQKKVDGRVIELPQPPQSSLGIFTDGDTNYLATGVYDHSAVIYNLKTTDLVSRLENVGSLMGGPAIFHDHGKPMAAFYSWENGLEIYQLKIP